MQALVVYYIGGGRAQVDRLSLFVRYILADHRLLQSAHFRLEDLGSVPNPYRAVSAEASALDHVLDRPHYYAAAYPIWRCVLC